MDRNTTLVFRGDDLIGQDPRVVTWGVRFYQDDQGISSRMTSPLERYTVVAFSAEPDMQEHKGISVYSCWVDHGTNVGWIIPDSAPSLSPAQQKTVTEWLVGRDPLVWEHMPSGTRSLFRAHAGSGSEDGFSVDSPTTPRVGGVMTREEVPVPSRP